MFTSPTEIEVRDPILPSGYKINAMVENFDDVQELFQLIIKVWDEEKRKRQDKKHASSN